jgi:hypothetical protein
VGAWIRSPPGNAARGSGRGVVPDDLTALACAHRSSPWNPRGHAHATLEPVSASVRPAPAPPILAAVDRFLGLYATPAEIRRRRAKTNK